MDFDICLFCYGHIDYSKLDTAYPQLAEALDFLPPDDMTLLEENIYWGNICLECAQLAESEAQGKIRPQAPSPAVIPKAGSAPGNTRSSPRPRLSSTR